MNPCCASLKTEAVFGYRRMFALTILSRILQATEVKQIGLLFVFATFLVDWADYWRFPLHRNFASCYSVIVKFCQCLYKLTHIFLTILTYFAILRQWFLWYHFCMKYFLRHWHYAAMFFVSQSFISSPPNPLHVFLSSRTSLWTIFDSVIVILSAFHFLLKVYLL